VCIYVLVLAHISACSARCVLYLCMCCEIPWFVSRMLVMTVSVSPANRLNQSRCRMGTHSCGPKKPCIRWDPDLPREEHIWEHMLTYWKGKGSPYSIAERRVPELIPVLGSQPADDVGPKPDSRLPLLSARSTVILATLTRSAANFAARWTEARWVWTVCLTLSPDSVATAIWTQALLQSVPESSTLTSRLPSHPSWPIAH